MKAQVKVAWVGLLQATSSLINDQTKSQFIPENSALADKFYRENGWPATALTELVATLQV
jgi:hypothetical protein